MEQYKQKLKTTRVIYGVAALVLILFSVLFFLSECGMVNITPATGDSHWQSRWRGFISGATCGIAGFIIVSLVRINRALRSEAELKKLYVQVNDERQQQIWTSARAAAMQICLMCGLVVGIVAGYFSITVSVTILVCTVFYCLVAAGCKLYYSRKY